MRKLLIGAFQIIAFLLFSCMVWASPIPMAEVLYIETDLGGGIFQYEYIVTNTSDQNLYPDVSITDVNWDFEYDPSDPLAIDIISMPDGWEYFSNNSYFVDTFTFMGPEIVPGSSLPGFIFEFNKQVGRSPFEAILRDEFYDYFVEGTTAPVPEPATILLLAGGMASIGAFGRKKFKKS